MKTKALSILIIGMLLSVCAVSAYADLPGLKLNFTCKKVDGAVEVYRDGKLYTKYTYKDTTLPYLYPLLSPSGIPVTREYPMKSVPQDQQDHPHHRSMWVGLENVNGSDFWTDGDKSGKIVNSSLDFDGVPGYWAIHTVNNWIGKDGKTIATENRRITFLSCDYGVVISTRIDLKAEQNELSLGGTKDGFFAIRLAPGLQLKGGTGHILNSQGDTDAICWGKRANWCDYTGKIDDKTVGITIFDSPLNYGHPTYWHARDYGLLAANPFGGKDFTNNPDNDSTLAIGSNETVSFVYSVLIHDGKLDKATLNTICDDVVGRGPSKTVVPGVERKMIGDSQYAIVNRAKKPEKPKVEPKPAVAPAKTAPTTPASVKPATSTKPASPARPAVSTKPAANAGPTVKKPASTAKPTSKAKPASSKKKSSKTKKAVKKTANEQS